MSDISNSFWVDWFQADEFERRGMMKNLVLGDVSKTLIYSYFEDLEYATRLDERKKMIAEAHAILLKEPNKNVCDDP